MRPLMNLGLAMALLTLSPMAFAEDPATSVQPEPADYFSPQTPEVSMTYDRGDVIPVEFGVRDWQDYYAYGLPSAPRGQEWVLIDNDAYLVRPDSGLVELVIRDIAGGAAIS